MAIDNPAAVSTPKTTHQWDEDTVFFALGQPLRRRVFLKLARVGPKPGSQLTSGPQLGTTLKQLAILCKTGLVVKAPNPDDRRQPLYALAPLVPLTRTENGGVIDFGFCLLRF
ncbi:MAG: hypothetical protein JWM68_1653 [Verrucomicrobiales bacterium]|nr:hypothetical protein [Verrucomicrobiales bacterium]